MSTRQDWLRDAATAVGEAVALEALDKVPVAVLLFDDRRREVHRNAAASALLDDRHSGVLAEAALKELVASARPNAGPGTRTLNLYGPPARRLIVRAETLSGGGLIGVIEDATEVSQLEAVRRDFVANVSHELRTPIGALLLLAEALSGETDPEVVARLNGRLIEEAERAAGIVQGLLDLSRLEVGHMDAPAGVAVADVVSTAMRTVAAVAEQYGVSITADAVDGGLVVTGDRAQMCSAVANLLDNAVKYSDPGGAVEIGASRDDGYAVVTVRDHGLGIPSADLDRIFERFYRVDRARSRETGGTGLGLSIVRHVAGNHGGDVSVESVEGEGAVFRLRLPVSRETT